MSGPTKLGDLTSADWDRVQALLDRFEGAWRDGTEPDPAAFLPPPGDPLRRLVLQELVKSDLEARWRRGRGQPLEHYLQRFPELGPAADLPPALVWEEYRVRRGHGDAPPLESYRARFPAQFPDLERRAREEPVPPTARPAVTARSAPAPAAGSNISLGIAPTATPGISFGMASAGSTLPIGGGYRLAERLGRGTFGEVWRAQAPGGVEVAIKLIFRPIDHEEAQRELDSLNLIKNLNHPFLIQTHAFWSLEDRLMIVMELADGSLRDRLKACAGGIPADELLRALRQTCEALDYLHGKNILHRDIKPDNVLLREGYVKVADMGLARLLQTQRSFSGTTCGSPVYMAPEVWSGRTAAASDLYSLAATYVELRRGRPLFRSPNMMELMVQHLQRAPDLDGLAPAEQSVLLRALAKAPADRQPSCLEFYRDLEQALAPPGPPPRPAGEPRPPAPTASIPAGGTPSVAVLRAPAEAPPTPTDDPYVSVLQSTVLPGITPPRPAARRRRTAVLIACLLLLALVPAAAVLAWVLHNRVLPDTTHDTAALDTRPASTVPVSKEPPGADFIPPDCVPAGARQLKAVGARRLYDRIAYTKGDVVIPFVLIVPETGKDPPFYIMVHKVSKRIYEAAAHRPAPASQPKAPAGAADEAEDYPVFGLTVDEAHLFAKGLGGELPTARQWDLAAGQAGPEPIPPGPFDETGLPLDDAGLPDVSKWKPGDFALSTRDNKGGPMALGEFLPRRDWNKLGCRDMASNGFEWTSSQPKAQHAPADADYVPVPFAKTELTGVAVRGMSYNSYTPYTFDKSDEVEASRYVPKRADQTSFRVVLPVRAR
jgi:serine/threonine protein kinase